MTVHDQPRYEPDPRLFGRRVLVELQFALHGRRLRYRRGGFRIDIDGLPGGLNLHNAYREYCTAPEARRGDVLEMWIGAVKDMVGGGAPAFGPLAEERASLVPIIERRYQVHAAARKAERGEPGWCQQSRGTVSTNLAVTLSVERPRPFKKVADRSLESWGIALEEGMATLVSRAEAARHV